MRLDERSWATGVEHLGTFTDSMPRSLVLASAWDSTRDAERPARDFATLVLEAIGTERDSTVLRLLLAQPGDHHPDVRRPRAPRAGARRRRGAAAGAWPSRPSRAATGACAWSRPSPRRPGHPSTPPACVACTTAPTRSRAWPSTPTCAGRCSAPSWPPAPPRSTRSTPSLARDNTASGQRAAAAARAAVPKSEAKEQAWSSVVESDALPNALQEAVISGFGRVHDVEPAAAVRQPVLRRARGHLGEPHERDRPAAWCSGCSRRCWPTSRCSRRATPGSRRTLTPSRPCAVWCRRTATPSPARCGCRPATTRPEPARPADSRPPATRQGRGRSA
nr:ERAP1-like C-terminal domain-containing protein [Angustibacter aerolatus]